MAKEEGFNRVYLQSVLEDTAAVTGLESNSSYCWSSEGKGYDLY